MRLGFVLVFSFLSLGLYSQKEFNDWFYAETIRLDYVLAGNFSETNAYVYGMTREIIWGGSQMVLDDPFVNGNYFFEIADLKSGSVIFRRSFNTLFGEWQTIPEAKQIFRAFQQSASFPCPRDSAVFSLHKRKDRNDSDIIMEVIFDPADYLIPYHKNASVFSQVLNNGEAKDKADLLFIAEGYTAGELDKFLSDVQRFTDYLLDVEPFLTYKNHFNIRALHSFSDKQGTSDPGIARWVDTPAGTSFHTFGSERYLTSQNYWKISRLAENIPHDQIIILVNTDKYGGGGIYNHYSIFTADHPLSEIVFVHEFAHAFAGLGDEYYDSEVAYESFYSPDAEPLPPNLTTLVDFESKWKDMVGKETPVPTPVKGEFEGCVGVFEGGGYVAHGVYRPQIDCRMKSNEAKEFCAVCKKALEQMILYYSY